MKCIDRKYSALVPCDQSHYSYEFEEFNSFPTATDFNFVHLLPDPIVYEQLNNLVVFQVEFPNCLISGNINNIDVIKYQDKIKKVITNCPFSVSYFNKLFNYDKFEFGFSPFNPKYIPQNTEKTYDVYYTGHAHNIPIPGIISVMNKFNPCFVCADFENHPTNHAGASYTEKLKLNSQSKITIVHGLLKWPEYAKRATDNLIGHRAFELVHSHGLVPQMKTRILDAAASKSIILCLQDHWNVIEFYFDRNIDFIYFKDMLDLEEKIHEISKNYEKYKHIADNAYNTLINNFTLQHFFEKYLKPL